MSQPYGKERRFLQVIIIRNIERRTPGNSAQAFRRRYGHPLSAIHSRPDGPDPKATISEAAATAEAVERAGSLGILPACRGRRDEIELACGPAAA